jgi:hypothetical protein
MNVIGLTYLAIEELTVDGIVNIHALLAPLSTLPATPTTPVTAMQVSTFARRHRPDWRGS